MRKLDGILLAVIFAVAFCHNAKAISYNEAIRQTNKLEGQLSNASFRFQENRARRCGDHFRHAQIRGVFVLPLSESAAAYLEANRYRMASACKLSEASVGNFNSLNSRVEKYKSSYIKSLHGFEIRAVNLAQKINRRLKLLSSNGSDSQSRARAERLKLARKSALAAASSARIKIARAQMIGLAR